jgi:hypothetical protein
MGAPASSGGGLLGAYPSVMADPVEHAAPPPPARRPALRHVGPGAIAQPDEPDAPGQVPSVTADGLRQGPQQGRQQGPRQGLQRGPQQDDPGTGASGAAASPPPGLLASYRRPLAIAVVVALAVPAVHGALWLTRPRVPVASTSAASPPAVTPSAAGGASPTAEVAAPATAVVTGLLRRRARAVVDRDRDAWLSTVDHSVPGLAAAQGELFERLDTVHPSSWTYELLSPDVRLTDAQRATLPPGAVLERVRLKYRLTPTAPEVTHEQHLTLVRRDSWLVGGTDAGPQQPDLWDLGAVAVARGTRSVVVAAAGLRLSQARTAAEADAAAARVDAVWGKGWPRTAVLFAPKDVEGMAALLGRSSTAGLDQLAAVTTGQSMGGAVRSSGDRVVLNPAGFAQLTSTGRAAVLRHELTHVATRTTSPTTPPRWVDEGFADYVAYLGTSLRPRDLAADLLNSPRTVRALRELPSDQQFDPTTGRVGRAYAEAWLAMRFVAQRGGTARVVDFYRVSTGLPALRRWPQDQLPRTPRPPKTALERACVEVLGYVEPSFVRRWVAYVRAVAR